jgi:hypothetical protein
MEIEAWNLREEQKRSCAVLLEVRQLAGAIRAFLEV